MTASWERVREIVLAAFEREPSARGPFLDEACAGDVELRDEVDSLLAAEADSSHLSRLDVAPTDPPGTPSTATFVPRAGARIGRYVLRREIASGGMGIVFEAEQKSPARIVAV